MKITKRLIALLLTVAMLASFAAMSGFEASAASATGRQVTNFGGMYFTDNKFKIMQLADIQTSANGGAMTARTIRTVKLAIEKYDPDLIIMTGDQTQGSANSSQWQASAQRFLGSITAATPDRFPGGYPLSRVAITFGNHDGESINRQDQQNYYVQQGCIDYDNNFSGTNLYGEGTGVIPILAHSASNKVAFNVVLFDSNSGGYNGGYSRIGHTNNSAYDEINNWYTQMTQTLGGSQYSYKYSRDLRGEDAYVPALCAQHIILQEIYTTGGLVAAAANEGVARYGTVYNSANIDRFKTNDGSLGLNEPPCATGGTASFNASTGQGSGDTWAQYNAIQSLHNCVGFTFGHDHDNYFDVTDSKGFRFIAASGLSQETYLTDGNPGVRVFDLTLNTSDGSVDMETENVKYSQLLTEVTGSVDNGRFEVLTSEGNQVVNTVSAPKVLFLGNASNSLNIQEFGPQLQTHIIDYKTKQWVEQNRYIKVCTPPDVSSVSLRITYNNGSSVVPTSQYGLTETKTVAGNKVFTFQLWSTQLLENSALTYEASYTTGGKAMKVYGSSWMRPIEMPGGYNTFIRGYAGSDNANKEAGWLSQKHVSMVHGVNVYSQRRGDAIDSDKNHADNQPRELKGGYFSYGQDPTHEPDQRNLTFQDKHDDPRYSLWQRSPPRMKDEGGVVLIGDYMQIRPGEFPLSTIYVDKGESRPVSSSDRRQLSGANLTYFITKDLDNGFAEYVAGLGFRTEDWLVNNTEGFRGGHDTGYSGGASSNPPAYKWFRDEMMTIPNAYNQNPNARPVGEWAYDDYAPNQSLSGITTTHTNGNWLKANEVGASRGESLSIPLISSAVNTWPNSDTTLTMVVGTRNDRNSNGWGIALFNIEMWRLEFKFYNKSQLGALVQSEMGAARQKEDYPHDTGNTAFNAYIKALNAAQALYARPDTTQQAIDAAYADLRLKLGNLQDTNKVPDETIPSTWGTTANRATALSVPHILYVSGTTIQTAAPYTARSIQFTVPSGATNVTCRAVTGAAGDPTNGAVTISSPSVSGTTYTWTVTGGTATDGGQVNYMFSYTKSGIVYSQYAASYVKAIPQHKAGWTLFNRNSKGSSKGYSHAIFWWMNFQNFFAAEGYLPIAGDMRDGMQEGVHFYDGEHSFGTFNGTEVKWDAYTKGIFCDQGGDDKEDWGSDGTSSNDYVGVTIRYDKKFTTVNQSVSTYVRRYPNLGSADYYSKTQDSRYYFTTSSTETDRPTSSWSNGVSEGNASATIAGITMSGYPAGANDANDWSTTFTYAVNFTGTNALSGDKYIRIRNYVRTKEERKNGWYGWNHITQFMCWFINFKAVDRTANYTAATLAITKNYPQDYMDPTWWNNYRTAALGNYKYIGNLEGTSDSNASTLTTLLNNAVYKAADYTDLIAAVNACMKPAGGGLAIPAGRHSVPLGQYGGMVYKVSSVSVSGIADEDSRYAGTWWSRDNFTTVSMQRLSDEIEGRINGAYKSGASEIGENVESNLLDFRYQTAIDNTTAAIIDAANKLRLAAADYTYFDEYKDFYNDEEHTMFFTKNKAAAKNQNTAARDYAHGDNGQWWQEGVFTNATVNTYKNARNVDRTLKKPSEQNVVGSLPRIYPADLSNPGTTACLYNTIRGGYEGLVFRTATEYTSATGTATDGSVTYYANYRMDKHGNYVYTADFSQAQGSASEIYASKRGYPALVSQYSGFYNGGVNTVYPVKDETGATVSTVTRFDVATWGEGEAYGFVDAYADVLTATNPTYSTSILALYVQRDIMPKIAQMDFYADRLTENQAVATYINSEVGKKPTYDIGGTKYEEKGLKDATGLNYGDSPVTSGSVTFNTTGKTWYTSATWNAYVAARDAAVAAQGMNYTASQQEQVNTVTHALYTARNALVPKKLVEYNGVYDTPNQYKTYNEIDTILSTQNTEITSQADFYTLTAAGTLNKTAKINKYRDSDVIAWNTIYQGTSTTGYSYYNTNKNTVILAEVYPAYREVLDNLGNAYNAKQGKPADYSQLAGLVNGDIVNNYYWRANYDVGGTGYNTNNLGSATGFEAGGTTTGATWYTPESWNAYATARNTGVATLVGSGTYDYNTVYTANQGGTTATKQADINTKVETLYNALKGLVPKKLNQYSVLNSAAWQNKTNYADINAEALRIKNEIDNEKGTVTTVTGAPTETYPGIPATYDLGSESVRPYYTNGFITDINSRYSTFEAYIEMNAANDLATTYNTYRSLLTSISTKYSGKTDSANINAADYGYLDYLLNRTWIPKYDTYGAGNYDGDSFILGSQFDGTDWYKPGTWNHYVTMRNAASLLVGDATYNRLKGYNNQYGAGTLKMNEQSQINTAVTDLAQAYYGLQYKTVNEYEGTWYYSEDGTAVGYADITDRVDSMADVINGETVEVWTQFSGSGDGITHTAVDMPKYDSANVATVMALRAALEGHKLASDTVNENIARDDLLAVKYNAYLNQLEAYKNAVAACTNGGYSAVYQTGWNWIFDQLNSAQYAVSQTLIASYLKNMFNMDTTAIENIIVAKEDLVSNGATIDNNRQSAMNHYARDLYDALVNTKVGNKSKQVNAAIAAANAKIGDTAPAYDPYQANGRAQVTTLNKYTQASIDELNSVITAAQTTLADLSLWDARPAVVGYTQLNKETDGSLASGIWAAAGITSATGVAHPETDPAFVLRDATIFTAALEDAIAFANEALYKPGTTEQKTTVAVNPADEDATYNTFTAESADELITALAAVNLTGAAQEDVDRWVCAIIENADIANTIKVKTTAGELYPGELTNVGADKGLKYNSADYRFVAEQIATEKPSKVAARIWDADNNNAILKETIEDVEIANGAYYYSNWAAYESAVNAGAADSGKKSNQQALVDALAQSIYETRNALEFKSITESSFYPDAEALIASTNDLRYATVNKVNYSIAADGIPTRTETQVNMYPEASVQILNNYMTPFVATYLENAALPDITHEGEMNAEIAEITAWLNTPGNLPTRTIGESEFAEGAANLVSYFIAGTHTRTNGNSNYASTQVPTTTQASSLGAQIRVKLDAIYDFLETKSNDEITALDNNNLTRIAALNNLTDDLYEYCTTTPARGAKFVTDLTNALTQFFNINFTSSVTVNVPGATQSVALQPTRSYNVFPTSARTPLNDATTYLNNNANDMWPYIYQLNGFDADYIKNTSTYTGNVQKIRDIIYGNGSFPGIGYGSSIYMNALESIQTFYTTAADWFSNNIIYRNRGNSGEDLVRIKAASTGLSPQLKYEFGTLTNATNKVMLASWYNTESGNATKYCYANATKTSTESYYLFKNGPAIPGSTYGSWFTDQSVNNVESALQTVNNKLSQFTGRAVSTGSALTMLTDYINAEQKLWTPAMTTNFKSYVQSDQSSLDQSVKNFVEAVLALQTLPANAEYREIAELIYAANAKTGLTYNDTAVNAWLPVSSTDNSLGGRIYNDNLLVTLGEGNYSAMQPDGYHYSTVLPGAYAEDSLTEDSLTKIITDFEHLTPLKIDKAAEVAPIKQNFLSRLAALAIARANFAKIIELAKAFLDNNENTVVNKGLGTYDPSTNAGSTFFGNHTGLGATGRALEYLTDEDMPRSDEFSPTGFYTFDKYTEQSLNAVLNYMRGIGILNSTPVTIFNVNFNSADHGGSLFSKYYHEQDDVESAYTGLVNAINNLELKAADTEALAVNITEADQIVADEDYYETDGEEWSTFISARSAAKAVENVNIIRQDEVDDAYSALAAAIAALVLYNDEYAPVLTMYNEASSVASFIADHPELNGISAETGTYIQPNQGGYTMYIYTNKLNPKFIITLRDTDSTVTAENGVKSVKVSKPEKIQIQGAGAYGAAAKVITPVLRADGTISSATPTTLSGNATANSQTAKGSDGKYAATSSAYAVLAPEFVANGEYKQQAVRYIIDAKDSARNKEDGTPNNQVAESFNFTTSSTEIKNQAAGTDGKITVMVYYMNNMSPIANDDEGYNVETGEQTGPTIFSEHEYRKKTNPEYTDDWVADYKVYRVFDSVVRNYEFISRIDTGATDNIVPMYNDPNFGTSNLGSFAYVLDNEATATTNKFDYYVAQMYMSSGAAAAKEKAKELLGMSSYLSDFKSYQMNSDRFMTFGAGDNWSKSLTHLHNGSLVYFHVLDRFGNVTNRVIEVNKVDRIDPVLTLGANPGEVNVTEEGGSGIQNIDLFKYAGTYGSSLYMDYMFNQRHVQEFDGAYVSENNTFTMSNLIPGGLYTLAVKDNVGRVGSVNVYADANGEITVTATEEPGSSITYNSDEPVRIDPIEDNGMMTFTLNGQDTIILNYGSLSSIVKAGPDGNLFANKSNVPLNIIAKSNVTKIKLHNPDTGYDVIWDETNTTRTTNDDGTVTWTRKQTFTSGNYSYTVTAMVDGEWEPYTVEMNFTATTRSVTIKFITIGMGKTTVTFNEGNRKSISTLGEQVVPYGSIVKLVAQARGDVDGAEFLCWKDNWSNRITSYNPVMEFTAVSDLELTPQFVTKTMVEENKKVAVYTNNAGGIINSYEFGEGGDYTVPDGPKLQDHVFIGWDMTKEQVKASDEKYVIVKPLYSLIISNTVEIVEGNYTASGAGTYASTDNERAIVNINASAKDDNGADFLYWRDVETGDIVTYSRAYAFYCIKDTVLEPVYGDASGVAAVPVARISTAKYDRAVGKVSFYAERSIPDSYEVYQTGVILTRTESIGTDESLFVIGTSGVGKGTSTSTAKNGFYAASMSANGGAIVYGRAYIIYKNAAGAIVTDYSPITTYTVQ